MGTQSLSRAALRALGQCCAQKCGCCMCAATLQGAGWSHVRAVHEQVLNDTATLSAQVYNDTLNLYNDTEVALTWPDWQEQWADMEEEAEGYGEEE